MTNQPQGGSRGGRQNAPGTESADPAVLREEIERTRKELGDTVEALAAKADIGARARDKAAELAERARQKASEVADAARDAVADRPPQAIGQVAGVIKTWRGPLLVAAAMVVLAGWVRWRWSRRTG